MLHGVLIGGWAGIICYLSYLQGDDSLVAKENTAECEKAEYSLLTQEAGDLVLGLTLSLTV